MHECWLADCSTDWSAVALPAAWQRGARIVGRRGRRHTTARAPRHRTRRARTRTTLARGVNRDTIPNNTKLDLVRTI